VRALPAWLAREWPDALMLTDAAGVIQYVNPAFERLTGYKAREVVGRTPALLKSGRQDRRFYARLWARLGRGETFRGVFVNRRKTGELFHEEEAIRPLRGPDGRIAYFLSAGRDVSARVRHLQKLERRATHDLLTGLPNRALFADRVEQGLQHAKRRREALALALLDVDRFKRVNTRFGHEGGDVLLKTVARRTRRALRAMDTVARVGGDEFALLLPAIRSRADVTRVLEKVRRVNAIALRRRGRRIATSVSIGASLYPRDGHTEATLRRRADRAMYRAKRAGGNAWRLA
jgi:diguanylate cyclase (GGDEF)-like protein/PAS domain S-box-containing protein